ncbi:hypothetical protein L9F63_015547, partial [Diploptera punctata]
MTGNLAALHKSKSSNEDLNRLQSSLRRFPFPNRGNCVTSSLLCDSTTSKHKLDFRSRRERVCKSWTSGYGTLVEDKEFQDKAVLLPDKQQRVEPQLLSSTLRSRIRRATSLVIATPWKTADVVPTHRHSRIDQLMPSLRSLVSRRSRAASSAGISGGRDMGGSSSSSVSAGNAAAVMVPLVKREASCSSLAPSIKINGNDLVSDVPEGASGGNMRKCETVLALSSFGAAMLRSASSSRTTIHIEPLKPVNRLRVPPHYSSSGLSPNAGGGSTSRMCSRCSSLLSMASSSRYSLNTAGGGFVPCQPEQTILCKLCLGEVPFSNTSEIHQCGCTYCQDASGRAWGGSVKKHLFRKLREIFKSKNNIISNTLKIA